MADDARRVSVAGPDNESGAAFSPRRQREQVLRNIERALALDPKSLDLQLLRAGALQLLGEDEQARTAYLRILRRDPDHLGALRNLSQLLVQTGFRSAARTLLERAVAQHPDELPCRVNLATLLFQSGEHAAARAHFERALEIAPDNPQAHAGLSLVLDTLGEADDAAQHRERGFSDQSIVELPWRGGDDPVRVLLLGATNQGNIPIERHLDDRTFHTWLVAAEFHGRGKTLPEHDLVVNAIGDADAAAGALRAAEALLARSAAPIINAPETVAATGRCENWRRMATLEGVMTPIAAMLPRAALAAPEAAATLRRQGLGFPLLLRAPGFHGGEHFLRVEEPGDLAGALAQLPGDELIAIEYIDTRCPDGRVRKYRVMMIDGALYPLHLAVASQWKVHYFSADMAANPRHRAEDERFLDDMEGVLGPRAMDALRRIQARLGLDYAGIDFALGPAREIVLFEANATMVVPQPGPESLWDYRRAAVARIDAAMRRMLLTRAKAPQPVRTR